MNKQKLNAVLQIIQCCTNSAYTGELRINFNQGGICSPIEKVTKYPLGFSPNSGFQGKITTTFTRADGQKATVDVIEGIWINAT